MVCVTTLPCKILILTSMHCSCILLCENAFSSTALVTSNSNSIYVFTQSHSNTRKLSYRKDDRAMRPIFMGALKIFGSP